MGDTVFNDSIDVETTGPEQRANKNNIMRYMQVDPKGSCSFSYRYWVPSPLFCYSGS